MPIERGVPWGSDDPLPGTAIDVNDDAALAAAASVGATHVRPVGGDIARTIGVTEKSLQRPTQVSLPIDLIAVTLDDEHQRIAAAHLAFGPRWRPKIVVMNAAFLGTANLAPRAHPGDGRLDVVTLELSLGDRIKAQRRMPTGSHVPHPDITIRRTATWEQTFDRPTPVRIDGRPSGRCRRVRAEVIVDGITVGV